MNDNWNELKIVAIIWRNFIYLLLHKYFFSTYKLICHLENRLNQKILFDNKGHFPVRVVALKALGHSFLFQGKTENSHEVFWLILTDLIPKQFIKQFRHVLDMTKTVPQQYLFLLYAFHELAQAVLQLLCVLFLHLTVLYFVLDLCLMRNEYLGIDFLDYIRWKSLNFLGNLKIFLLTVFLENLLEYFQVRFVHALQLFQSFQKQKIHLLNSLQYRICVFMLYADFGHDLALVQLNLFFQLKNPFFPIIFRRLIIEVLDFGCSFMA